MKKPEFVTSIVRSVHKAGFAVKKHSPEILIVAGVVGTVASAVIACRSTLKVKDILDEAKEDIDKVHEVLDNDDISEEKYSQEDGTKDLVIIYSKTAVKLVKLYAPAVILGALSITSILTSHNIMRKRNVALAAAYATVDGAFKNYRKRVVERFGEELDKELRYNIKSKEVEKVVADEDGNEKTVKETVTFADIDEPSEFARFFDEGCRGWTKDAEVNLMFLRQQQNYANEILKARGHMFLNEIYRMLDIPQTQAGQIVGWIYDPNNQKHKGDNYIDFGIYDHKNEAKRRFVNGDERSILLDFNVDGPIINIYK